MNPKLADKLPYKILCRCSVTRNQLSVQWHGAADDIPASLKDQIDAYWRREIEETPKRDYIFNGDLCRLRNWQAASGRLTLELGYTNYKQLLYSNHLHETAGQATEVAFCARALGISAIVVTADKQFVLMRRSQAVGEGPGRLDVLGGHVEPVAHLVNGVPDPFFAMQEELLEEVNLRPGQMVCIGLVETVVTRKPEMVFACNTREDARNLLAAAKDHGCPEVAELIALKNEHDILQSFVATQMSNFSPSAAGCVGLYLKYLEETNVRE